MDSCVDTSGGDVCGVIEGFKRGLQRIVRSHPPIDSLSLRYLSLLSMS